jgi:hypothetical protein
VIALKRFVGILAAGLLLAAGSLTAQTNKWEGGVSGGASFYQQKSFDAVPGSAEAGFKTSFSAGAWLGQDMHEYIGGEIRYQYGDNDARLKADGQEITFGARTHTVHYDVLVHTSPRESNVRPFFTAGFGAKGYYGTGAEGLVQPMQDYLVFTRTSEWKPVVTFGGGVKFRVSDRIQLRVELKDYFSPFPTEVMLPALGADLGGWIHNLVPMAGIGFTF